MNSLDVRGKFWITQEGVVIDCSADEHARIARAHMLGISADKMNTEIPLNKIFSPLTKIEVFGYRDRGISQFCLDFLSQDHPDPRIYAIKNWSWIRTRENVFYAWEWDETALLRLLFNENFWKRTQVKACTWLKFVSVRDGSETGNTYGLLRQPYLEMV